jgi:uncharacterized protein (TIGR03000 family)
MKRQWLWFLLASVGVAATLYSVAIAGRGSGHSSQYAVGRSPVRTVTIPTNQESSEYTYGATADDVVEMVLRVPSTAEVWFNGTKTAAQTKAVRRFVTPALEPGQDYTYDIRVRWREKDRPLEQTRRIMVRAGDRITLNLMDMPATPTKSASGK